jgi:glucosamine 6-phosphate synthetase-like amidotransferase/phosphosugar isomerase protein
MLREIHEQPETLAATLNHYVEANAFAPETCKPVFDWLGELQSRILIAASGSSRHASMVAELTIETLSDIDVDVEYASEYCYRSENGLSNASVLVVSQSGETADTLAALRKAVSAGHRLVSHAGRTRARDSRDQELYRSTAQPVSARLDDRCVAQGDRRPAACYVARRGTDTSGTSESATSCVGRITPQHC